MPIFRYLISGRVQGVSFRFTIKRFILEQKADLPGFIRNLANGDVELVLEHTAAECQLIENACRTKVRMARVDGVICSEVQDYSEKLPFPFTVLPNK